MDPHRPDGLEHRRGPAASRSGAHLPLPHTPASPPGRTGRGKREPALVHGPTSACSQAVHPLRKLPGVALPGGPHGPNAAWRCYVPPLHPRELGTRLQGPPTGRNPGPLLSRAVGLRKRGSSWVRVEGGGPPCPLDTALLWQPEAGLFWGTSSRRPPPHARRPLG